MSSDVSETEHNLDERINKVNALGHRWGEALLHDVDRNNAHVLLGEC